jgi:ABC-2 type transport system ATP-binding protein
MSDLLDTSTAGRAGDALAPPIAAANITKRYGQKLALDDVSIAVPAGLVTGLVGPNGAGKTTLMRILLGDLNPTAGAVTYAGVPLAQVRHRHRKVGASIDTFGLDPGVSPTRFLKTLALAAGLPKSRVDEVLTTVSAESFASVKIGSLSTGMRQRIDLAAAIMADPEILIFDEPLNGLDPDAIEWFRGFLDGQSKLGQAIVVSSHILAELDKTADRVVIIHEGVVRYDGAVDSGRGSIEDLYFSLTREGSVT